MDHLGFPTILTQGGDTELGDVTLQDGEILGTLTINDELDIKGNLSFPSIPNAESKINSNESIAIANSGDITVINSKLLDKANNLSDIPLKASARSNLEIPDFITLTTSPQGDTSYPINTIAINTNDTTAWICVDDTSGLWQQIDNETLETLITANSNDITTNTGNISTNTGNISTNTGNISTNTGNISTNTTDIGNNTTNITNLQSDHDDAALKITPEAYNADVNIGTSDEKNFSITTNNLERLTIDKNGKIKISNQSLSVAPSYDTIQQVEEAVSALSFTKTTGDEIGLDVKVSSSTITTDFIISTLNVIIENSTTFTYKTRLYNGQGINPVNLIYESELQQQFMLHPSATKVKFPLFTPSTTDIEKLVVGVGISYTMGIEIVSTASPIVFYINPNYEFTPANTTPNGLTDYNTSSNNPIMRDVSLHEVNEKSIIHFGGISEEYYMGENINGEFVISHTLPQNTFIPISILNDNSVLINGQKFPPLDSSNDGKSLRYNDTDKTLEYTDIDATELTNLNTDNVPEASNLYYTDARVDSNTNVVNSINHIGDNDKHRVIDDLTTSTTNLWSADKIQSEINTSVGGITYDQSLNTSDNVEFVDMTVNGDLKVNGTTTTINSTEVSINDPTLHLAANNIADTLDIGVHGCFMNTNMYCTGIRRDATNKEWYLFKDYDMTTNGALDETTDLSTLALDDLNVGDIKVAGNSANTHITDDDKHRVINDAGTSAIDLWSADKIASEISSGVGGITYDQTLNTTDDVIFNNISVGAAGTSQIAFDPLKKSDGTVLSNTDFKADGGINEIALTLAEVGGSEEFKMNTFGFVGIASDDIDYTETLSYSPDGFETGLTGATISNAGLSVSITDASASDQRYVGITNTFSSDDTAVFEFKASGIVSTFLNPTFGLMYDSTVREPPTSSFVGVMMNIQFNPTQLLGYYVKNDPVGGAWEMESSSGGRILIQSPTFTFVDEEKFRMTYNGATTDFTLEQDKGAGYVQVFTHKFSDFTTTYPSNEPLTFFVGDSNANNNASGPIVFDILNSGGGAAGTILTYETNENKMVVYQSDGSIVDKGTITTGFPTFVSTDIIKVVSSGSNIQFQKNDVPVSTPYAVPTGILRYAVGSTTGIWNIDTQQKITASLDVKAHIEDDKKHRIIDDLTTSTTNLWSSDKIKTSLTTTISPSADNTYDLGSASFRYNECYADAFRGRYLRSVGSNMEMDCSNFVLTNSTATTVRDGYLYMDTNGIFNIAGDSLGGLMRILTRGDGSPANSGDILIGSGYQIQATFSHQNGVIFDVDTKINATTNTQNILPLSNNTYNLGSSTLEFNTVNCADFTTTEGVMYLNANNGVDKISLSSGQLDVWSNDINNTGNIEAKIDNTSDIGSDAIKYKDLHVNNIKNAGGNIPIDTGCIVVRNTSDSTNEAIICMNSADQFTVGAFTQGGDMSIFTKGNGVPTESGVISMNPGEVPVASFSQEEGFSVVTDFRYNMGAFEAYYDGNTALTTINTANTPTQVLYDGMVDSFSQHFTVDGTNNIGRITYNGNRTKRVHCGVTLSFDCDQNNTVLTFYMYKNGVLVGGSTVKNLVATLGKYQSTAIHYMPSLAPNDYLELFLEADKLCDVNVSNVNLFGIAKSNVIV